MIHFEKFILSNGLQVVVNEDPLSHTAVVNVMYYVGSRDEDPSKTGLAHLFEHLMFGGSRHIPSYDAPLQQVGGDNNAYTTTDNTNYYCVLPAVNIETAFWLESDRMLGLAFNEKSLEVQRKVVIEEFKELYLNKPYGDLWHRLMELAYTTHTYKWPTIGSALSHIEAVTMEDIKRFSNTFYRPSIAVLVVSGGVKRAEIEQLCKKWFEPIPGGVPYKRSLPVEPVQQEARSKILRGDVPFDLIYKAYHMPSRDMPSYYTAEVLSNLLGVGKSALLYDSLVVDQMLYTTMESYITESFDKGLLIVSGNLSPNVHFDAAEYALLESLHKVSYITDRTLEKVKNQMEAQLLFSQISAVNRAQDLAEATLLGDTDLVNKRLTYIQKVSVEAIREMAQHMLQASNCTTLYYQANAAASSSNLNI